MDSSDNQSLLAAFVQSEAQKQAIVDGFKGLLIYFDPNKQATWVNRATLDLFPDAVGKKCYEIFCGREAECQGCALQRSFDSGTIESGVKHTGINDTAGDELVFDLTSSPIRDDAGSVSGHIIIAQNITDQFRLEKRLRHTQKMEAIGTLAGGVAHDFNNILTPIMGYSEIIRLKMKQNDFGDSSVYDYLDEILKAAKRAKSLVEQVLTFSRGMEKKAALQYLHPIVKEAMRLVRTTFPSTITITEEVDECCGRVLIDPVQIHQVLLNLCTNSANAMDNKHGKLRVKLRAVPSTVNGESWLELSVADTGCGIEQERLERIFEPFYSTREKTSGTGMGLAMVHGIVSGQGGHITVESEVGRGSVFKIYLPVARQESSIDQIVSLGELRGGSGRILLIDDEEQVVQVTGEILKSLGYRVTGSTSPVEALNLFSGARKDFDLVLTDLTMPELTGLELSEKIKKVRPDIPVVLFTGYSEQVPEASASAAGIDDFCAKPISMRGLSAIVGKFLN
ncbi:MAG: hybrid sensor histidine kinase/response regulator [Desulforhopalus sp.]